jgi:hypothetical protein
MLDKKLHLVDFYKDKDILSSEEIEMVKRLEEESFDITQFNNSLIKTCKLVCKSENISQALSINKLYHGFPLGDSKSMKRGLEIVRLIYSYYAAKHRGANSIYLDEGVVIYKDVFDSNTHKQIKNEIDTFPLRVNSNQRNLLSVNTNTVSYKSFFSTEIQNLIFDTISLDATHDYKHNTFVQRLNKTSEAHLLEKDGNDSQYRCHADIFAPSLKWWYFPNEVKIEHGPLCYARNSCSLDKNLLDWWYKETCDITAKKYIPDWKEPSHTGGSPRIEEEELIEMGYKFSNVECESNTLVIANVHGFHRRGKPTDWTTNIRSSIHSSIRVEPFKIKR